MKGTAGLVLLVAGFVAGGIIDNRVEDCSARDDPMGCLTATAVVAIERASRMQDIEVLPGVSLVKEADWRESRQLTSAEQLEADLQAQQPEDRTSKMLDLLYDAGLRFLKSHSLKLKVPEGAPETLQRALEEGRAKIKKKLLPILMLVGVKLVTLLPLALGAIGLMALKALVVGKIALVIAAVIAFQKFFSGGSGASVIPTLSKTPVIDYGSSSGSGGWASSGSSSSGPYYRRSMETSHDLAYSAQIPTVDNNSAQ
ncbi:uncharacterized protein [Halyomorpha halys]|uniref:uncharacterized protein n=1 Tax=Halyomorpha halys TaxID=286706 RepID=UPI0006D4E2D6|nr:uncharacterized protein LOC106684980 [Halyomorpha halys]